MVCSGDGEIVNGELQSKGADWAYFKHAQEVKASDVLRMPAAFKARYSVQP